MSKVLGTALLLSTIVTHTGFAETIHDGRTWINLTMQGRVRASRWRWHLERTGAQPKRC
jgi:hypothetical protein